MSNTHYRVFYSEEAIGFLHRKTKVNQRKIIDISHMIAQAPTQLSDHQTQDLKGRILEHVHKDKYFFVYWIDQAAKEVHVLNIDQSQS